MDKQKAFEALAERCFALRMNMSDVFKEAGVSSATMARWGKNPNSMRASKVLQIEKHLDYLESQK